jgi:hypothetical protein
MPKNVKLLLADLQRVVQQMSDENGKEEGQLAESETSALDPDPASASNSSPDEIDDVIIKANGQAPGLVIGVGVDKNNPMKLERIEVMPEPEGRVRVMVRAKKQQD